ncbi:MAG: hypothetical protein V1809_12925 [Planctomycetota bacterium]
MKKHELKLVVIALSVIGFLIFVVCLFWVGARKSQFERLDYAQKLALVEKYKGREVTRNMFSDEEIKDFIREFESGPPGELSRAKALVIAKQEIERDGHAWRSPGIRDKGARWEVVTNVGALGGNAHVFIDKRTGKVTNKFFNGL